MLMVLVDGDDAVDDDNSNDTVPRCPLCAALRDGARMDGDVDW